MRGGEHRRAAVGAERDRLDVLGRGDLVHRDKRRRHGLEQHERRLLFRASLQDVRTAPDTELRHALGKACDLAALVRNGCSVPGVRNEPHPLAHERRLAAAGRREHEQRKRRALPDIRRKNIIQRVDLPRYAQIERGNPPHARDAAVLCDRRAAQTEPVAALERQKALPHALCIAVYRVPRRAADGFAQLVRRHRRQRQRALRPADAHAWRFAAAQPQLLDPFLLRNPAERGGALLRQARDRLHPYPILSVSHVSSPAPFYERLVRKNTAVRRRHSTVFAPVPAL